MSAASDVVYLADHSLVLAIPAVAPAFVIVGVVLFVVLRDRRAEKAEADDGTPEIERIDTE
ncbi:hypothetical protein ACNHUS_08300 [Actinomycetes bacterium M1A6_2h]